MRYFLIAIAALNAVATPLQTPPPNQNPEIGSWLVNVSKSTYRPGPPPIASVLKWEKEDGEFTVSTFVAIDPHGNPTFNLVRFKYDGKDYPVYSNANLAAFLTTGAKVGTGSYKVVAPNTVEATIKDNTGKVTATATRVVSTDGKTLTATGTDASGRTTNVTVWERQ